MRKIRPGTSEYPDGHSPVRKKLRKTATKKAARAGDKSLLQNASVRPGAAGLSNSPCLWDKGCDKTRGTPSNLDSGDRLGNLVEGIECVFEV